jgi:hypothetical protein
MNIKGFLTKLNIMSSITSLSDFQTEFAILKKVIKYDHIDRMIDLISFSEENGFIDEDEAIDSEMDVMKYTLKVLDANLIVLEDAETIIWDLIEDVETGGNEVYQKSTGYGEGYYEIPKHKQTEWDLFKEDILDSLDTYDDDDEPSDPRLTFDDIYEDLDDYLDYDGGYECESWECLDM